MAEDFFYTQLDVREKLILQKIRTMNPKQWATFYDHVMSLPCEKKEEQPQKENSEEIAQLNYD